MKVRSKSKPGNGQPTAWRRYCLVLLIVAAIASTLIGPALLKDDGAAPDGSLSANRTEMTATSSAPSEAVTNAVLPVRTGTSWNEIDDPSRDGWTIEVRAEQARQTLYRFGELVFGTRPVTQSEIDHLGAADYHGSALFPDRLRRDYMDELIQVDRWSRGGDATATGTPTTFQGLSGLKAAVSDLAATWQTMREKRFEFKVFRAIERPDNMGQQTSLETHQYVAASGNSNDKSIEQHATWVVHWALRPNSDQLRLRSIELVDFEQTTCRSDRKLFADCTTSILKANDCYQSQFLHGMNYWLQRNQDMRYFSPLGNPGLAVADVNGDGLDDLYVCQEVNLPNRLFLQQPDGTARDVSADWRVDFLEGSRGALLVDLDNDGDQDLAVAILGGLVVASNELDQFVVRDVLATDDDTTSLTAADYDLDGDLDLYVCVDYPNDEFASSRDIATLGGAVQGGAANRVYHDANNAGRNCLFRNDIAPGGRWSFVDVTAETGIDQNNRRFSWASCWEDYDNDGDQDLYVANDFGRNNLYSNDNGRFTDVAKTAGVEDSAAGMSAAWADVNHDGNMDLYVANMYSSAGSRITEQTAFKRDSSQQMKARWRQFALGNTLFSNRGNSEFRDTSEAAGVTLGRWSWSSNFLDINNDGWQDIAVANGYITSNDTSDL